MLVTTEGTSKTTVPDVSKGIVSGDDGLCGWWFKGTCVSKTYGGLTLWYVVT